MRRRSLVFVEVSLGIGDVSVVVEDRSIVGLAICVGTETEQRKATTVKDLRTYSLRSFDMVREGLAARGHDGAHTLNEVGVSTPGGQQVETPMRSASEGSKARANRVKKPRRNSAVQNRGWARSREGDDARTVNAPALVLVVDNGWRRDYRRPKGSPSPALRHPLLMLVHSTNSGEF
jgi:hypothetical protein